MPITVGLLGAFTLAGLRGTVDLSGRRQCSLAAILALEGGRIVSAARLIDLLWPDMEPVDPLNALQHQVSRLRAAIGRAQEGGDDEQRDHDRHLENQAAAPCTPASR